ncbi:nitroreductase family protein [Fibrobacter intestinalis]|uniref:Nitroreductase n=1 Tax=Fibrobacter intestinalis TaxID=28122 RepID=A0A1T4R9A4_9BACT|nr:MULTISPECIES: nitroreductase family protein [Fibrobacter]PBC74664.1 nitroreductase [Fibrobacter sp. NR9]SKA12396.1 Nitroreductase [Fibrobacter intestinalis]
MNTFECICSRRSTRRYKALPVEQEKLEKIILAGRFAPSGGNNQTNHFLVIRNADVLRRLAELVESIFSKMEVTDGMYKSIRNSILNSRKGGYVFHYRAPVLIVVANQKDYGNNMADVSVAIENMMLEANELDLGSCWINQLRWLNENPTLLAYLQTLGLLENERVYGSVAIGYPLTESGFPLRQPLPRTGNLVTFV